jgi:hypothetical protein
MELLIPTPRYPRHPGKNEPREDLDTQILTTYDGSHNLVGAEFGEVSVNDEKGTGTARPMSTAVGTI